MAQVMAIYAFYKHRRNHMKLNPSSKHNGLYLRLMAVSLIEILGTIPIGTYNIVSTARMGVVPWKGWAVVHRHYSEVEQIASSIWRNDSVGALNLERFRWSLVASAFLFFALFGLASEAREHYYSLYLSLARRMGKSVITPHESFACVVSRAALILSLYSFRLTSPIFFTALRHHRHFMLKGMMGSATLS